MYFSANSKVAQKDKALKEAQTELTDWQNKNAALQQYKTRQDQVSTLETSVVTALQGRVYWARILNNIAMTMPSDIWITSLVGSSGEAASPGTVEFSGYALQCPNRDNVVDLYPYLPDYKPIANWLERMAQIVEFQRVWLGSAEPTRQGTELEQTVDLSLIHISEPTRLGMISYAVFCLKKKKKTTYIKKKKKKKKKKQQRQTQHNRQQ